MTLSEPENYCTEDPTTHENDAPSIKDSENTLLEECGNTFSIHDSIFAGKLEEGTRQASIEEAMCGSFYGDDPSWEGYTDSYRDAADHLVERIERCELDSLVYPIMFLYRHYLELQLKSLLRNFYLLHSLQCSYPLKETLQHLCLFHGIQCRCPQKKHNLVELWDRVRPLIEEMYLQDTEDNKHIEARIKEFNQIDPKSLAFRYPEDTDGNPSFESVPQQYRGYINLFRVRGIVEDMHERLRGMNEYLCVTLQEAAYWIPPSRE